LHPVPLQIAVQSYNSKFKQTNVIIFQNPILVKNQGYIAKIEDKWSKLVTMFFLTESEYDLNLMHYHILAP